MKLFRTRFGLAILLTVAVVGLVVLPFLWFEQRAELRESQRIVVVLPERLHDSPFVKGVRLALGEVNKNGGIANEPVGLEFIAERDYTSVDELEAVVASSLSLAGRISNESGVLVVLGHHSSATAVPASSVYALRGTLYFATHATDASLTNHGFRTVFALQPNNADIAATMASYAIEEGMKTFVLLSDATDTGRDTVKLFESAIRRSGGQVPFSSTINREDSSLDLLIGFMLDNQVFNIDDVDAIFVAASSHETVGRFVRRARELNLDTPMLGTDLVFNRALERFVGLDNMKDVIGVSLYDPDSDTPENQQFVGDFSTEYGFVPGKMAAIGYDSVKLLDFVTRNNPDVSAEGLADRLVIMHFKEPFVGANGSFSFTERGLITDTDVFIVRHDGDGFHTVATFNEPGDWLPTDRVPARGYRGREKPSVERRGP